MRTVTSRKTDAIMKYNAYNNNHYHYIASQVQKHKCKHEYSQVSPAGFPLYFRSEIQALLKDPEVAFLKTNYRWKFTASTVLQQYLICICVITVQF